MYGCKVGKAIITVLLVSNEYNPILRDTTQFSSLQSRRQQGKLCDEKFGA